MPVRQSRRGARATACAAGMLGALAAASVNEALAQRPPVLTDPTPTVKNITEFVGDALDDLCEYNPELPICKDDPGLDVGLPDVVHDLCALFPQVCDGEDVPPGSDSLPGNFSLPDGVGSLTDLICASVPDLCFDGRPVVRPQVPQVDCTVSGPKKKKQCKAKPAGSCVFQRKGKQCLPTPWWPPYAPNGRTCSAFGKKKLCERVSGCLWSGSRKTGSCGQP